MADSAAPPTGRIVLVATPIGNLGDLSPRAVQALTDADVVAAEDTRRTGRLLSQLDLQRPLVRYDDHTERGRTAQLVDRAAAGETVVVATDAGTPGISDPGYVLVRAAVDRGVPVELVPGPVAAVHALVLSGLPTDRFVFEGFLPRRPAQRRAAVAALVDERRTVVLYLSPHRAADELADLAEALGPRPAALGRELTKLHEQIVRLPLHELAATVAAEGARGELTLVLGGAEPEAPSDARLVARVRELRARGASTRDAAAQVAHDTGVSRRRVYELTLRAREADDPLWTSRSQQRHSVDFAEPGSAKHAADRLRRPRDTPAGGAAMAVALQRRRLTVDEFHHMAESGVLGEDERLELWDGELVEMSPIGGPHAQAVRQLIAALARIVPGVALLDVQGRLTLDVYSQVAPDVMLLRPRAGGYRDLPTPTDVLLLVEVAETSIAFDRGAKADRYAAAGVGQYWVVDLPGRCVWTMTRPELDGYGDVDRHEDGMVMAMGVGVDVAALL